MGFCLVPHVFSLSVNFGYSHEPVQNSTEVKALAARSDSQLELQKLLSLCLSLPAPVVQLLGLCCISPALQQNEPALMAGAYYCLLRT